MKKVITYGTYDLLHYGHVRLLERAKELGDYLIVGVTSDLYDKERGKLNVSQTALERAEAVRALGIADEIILEEYEGQKVADIKKYEVDVFTVGSDWRGYFDYLNEYCDVVYLERTEGVSSTQLRRDSHSIVRAGIVGMNRFSLRLLEECAFVSGVEIVGCTVSGAEDNAWDEGKVAVELKGRSQLLEECDAVFIFGKVEQNAALICEALDAGCHVFCDAPAFASEEAALRVISHAKERGLLFFEGMKTVFFPAFEHLLLMVDGGSVGPVVDVSLSCTQIPGIDCGSGESAFGGAMCEWGALASMPIIKILGGDFSRVFFNSVKSSGKDIFTRATFSYGSASASFCVGRGVKTENDLVVTGTKGFIYVPSPWWRTDYFEIRHEDLRKTRKVFYQFAGEGLRYEVMEFVRGINQGKPEILARSASEVACEARVLETFLGTATKW